ncbi:MAG TPA: hypothetical protein VF902_02150 [Coriobacteriia bacterium]
MRLVVVDASAVGGGPVTRALECAAREVARQGADVEQVRLYSLFTTCCASCGKCRASGRCSVRHDAIDRVSESLLDADLLLAGVVSSASQRDRRAEVLLRRLVGSFGRVYDSRYGESTVAEAGCMKRAGLVSSAPPLLGAAVVLGTLPYGLSGVWRVLDRAGVEVVGAAAVARRWSGPASWDVTRERAVKLGRALAVRPIAPVVVPAPAPQPALPGARVRVA